MEEVCGFGGSEPLGLTFEPYANLVDYTGRCIREGERGHVPAELAPILARMSLDAAHWVETVEREVRKDT